MTATVPTELIAFDGQPQYAPLVSDQLLYATNTESDVIREIPTQHIYVLLAGRWFRSLSMSGPWEFVRGDDLPASFAQVAPDSPKGHILASVSGTDQADDAIADSEIPQTSAISRDDHHFSVNYDGAPQFESIEGSSLQYAINTDAEVIFADGRYYACDQGVWYIADSPNGPWSVSETRPVGLDDVPPSCPVYNARYVYIYDATPTVIYMGYLPGYLGCYPHYGSIVYGTGYYYRPWRGHLYYYPRPCTWGYYPRYNPWLSGWSFGFSYGDGFLRVGTRWRSVPVAARPPVRPLWFGPGGYHRPLMSTEAVLVRTRRQALGRGKLSDRAPMNLYNRTDNVVRVDRTAARMPAHMATGAPIVASKIPNNVFAGRDGKVYRRETGGAWKVNSGTTWQPTHLPTSQTQIDRLAHTVSPGTSYQAGGAAHAGRAAQRLERASHALPAASRPLHAAARRLAATAGRSGDAARAGQPRARIPGTGACESGGSGGSSGAASAGGAISARGAAARAPAGAEAQGRRSREAVARSKRAGVQLARFFGPQRTTAIDRSSRRPDHSRRTKYTPAGTLRPASSSKSHVTV